MLDETPSASHPVKRQDEINQRDGIVENTERILAFDNDAGGAEDRPPRRGAGVRARGRVEL